MSNQEISVLRILAEKLLETVAELEKQTKEQEVPKQTANPLPEFIPYSHWKKIEDRVGIPSRMLKALIYESKLSEFEIKQFCFRLGGGRLMIKPEKLIEVVNTYYRP